MSEFRCPNYYYDGSQWRCTKTGDYLTLHDFDTYCTNESKCRSCSYYNR
ncbi:MAG: hypothetical protein VB071_10935 [Lawsonibacter sp.]|nr:hypothetical protein [Lawsonibacter sp.]